MFLFEDFVVNKLSSTRVNWYFILFSILFADHWKRTKHKPKYPPLNTNSEKLNNKIDSCYYTVDEKLTDDEDDDCIVH